MIANCAASNPTFYFVSGVEFLDRTLSHLTNDKIRMVINLLHDPDTLRHCLELRFALPNTSRLHEKLPRFLGGGGALFGNTVGQVLTRSMGSFSQAWCAYAILLVQAPTWTAC